jgi:hypothetical protein
MASSFKPVLGAKYESGVMVRSYSVDSGATFTAGELTYFDTSTQTLKGCGANPTLIAGISFGSAAFALGTQWPGNIYQGTKIPVALIGEGVEVFMSSATTPAATHIGNQYGLVNTSGTWQVNISDTTNIRIIVVDIYNTPQQEGFLVRFDPKYLQFAGTQA